MSALLEIQNLHVHFANAPAGHDAVNGVSLSIAPGEILGLVGESGSGKTVTAMTVSGLLPRGAQVSGTCLFDGRDLNTFTEKDWRALQGDEVAVVFQEPMSSMNPTMRIGPQIEECLRLHTSLTPEERRARALRAMTDVELPDPETVYRRYPHELSGGMLQRAMIAAAIVSRPKLLLADEPTTALDVTIQAQILTLLQKINREMGTTILFISHNLHVVRKLCTRVVVMQRGKIVETGAVEDIFRAPQQEYTRNLIASIPTRQHKLRDLYRKEVPEQ